MSMPNSTSEYLLLFRGGDWDKNVSPAELQSAVSGFLTWFERLNADGILKAGQPLLPESRIVSGKNGRSVADGPFAESKEAVGGYFLIKAEGFDEAVAIAQQCPILEHGAVVEVRPIAADCPTQQRAQGRTAQQLSPTSP